MMPLAYLGGGGGGGAQVGHAPHLVDGEQRKGG